MSSSPPVRTLFFGTADLARAVLDRLLGAPEIALLGVVSQPDRPRGRDLRLQLTPVKQLALSRQLPVWQPQRAREETFVRELAALQPELILVAAYGQILPTSILDLPRHGCLNVHTSLLPQYRGAAPIQWALLEGARETGVTIMRMDAGLDTGDILTQEKLSIEPEDDAQTLHDRLATLGGDLLARSLPAYLAGEIPRRPQLAEGVSYARKLSKEDGFLNWTETAVQLRNRIRAFTPWPGASTCWPAGERMTLLKIWRAEVVEGIIGTPGEVLTADRQGIVVACGRDALRINELQREGGRRLAAADFLAGHPMPPGGKFEDRK